MDLSDLFDRERLLLREELHNLKKCQVTFLTTSVTATGAILGFAVTLISTPLLGVIFLFPLIILLPSWWIFFDKATTITRIVGYYRNLEKLIFQNYIADNFIGWENALCKFRKRQVCGELKLPEEQKVNLSLRRLVKIVSLQTTHRYLVISYYTFFALSVLCVILSITTIKNSLIFTIPLPAILLILSTVWNARIVWELIHGHHSFESNEYFWSQILGIREAAHSQSRSDIPI